VLSDTSSGGATVGMARLAWLVEIQQ